MAHGHPDYGIGAPVGTIYPVLDIGELATRLGSPDTFDRRGNVIWLDNFEDTLKKWDSDSNDAAGSVEHTAEAARSGAFSVKLTTPPTVDYATWLYCYRPLPVPSKIGFEVSYAMYLQIQYIYLRMSFMTATARYRYYLRYDRYNTTMSYYNSSGGYTDLAGSPSHQMLYHAWNTIKLVADHENNKYVRALLNNFSWDLSDIAPHYTSGSYTPSLYLEIRITNREAGQHYLYLDDVILTQNEP